MTTALLHHPRVGAVLAAVALSLVALVAVDGAGPLRSTAAVAFLLVGPGLALVRLLRLDHVPLALALAVALSVAVDLVVAQGLMWLDAFGAVNGMVAVAAVTVAALALDRGKKEARL